MLNAAVHAPRLFLSFSLPPSILRTFSMEHVGEQRMGGYRQDCFGGTPERGMYRINTHSTGQKSVAWSYLTL